MPVTNRLRSMSFQVFLSSSRDHGPTSHNVKTKRDFVGAIAAHKCSEQRHSKAFRVRIPRNANEERTAGSLTTRNSSQKLKGELPRNSLVLNRQRNPNRNEESFRMIRMWQLLRKERLRLHNSLLQNQLRSLLWFQQMANPVPPTQHLLPDLPPLPNSPQTLLQTWTNHRLSP